MRKGNYNACFRIEKADSESSLIDYVEMDPVKKMMHKVGCFIAFAQN